MTVKEAIDIINKKNDIYSVSMFDAYIDGEVVKQHQDDEEYVWFTISTRVWKLEDGYVGVRGPYVNKSKYMSWKEIIDTSEEHIQVFEMEPVPDVYYKIKS